jgi:hypothetical protein
MLLLLAAFGCRPSKPDGQLPVVRASAAMFEASYDPSGSGSPVSAADTGQPELDRWISQLVKGPDTTVTLRRWLSEHPGDSVGQTIPTGLGTDAFCRSAAASIIDRTKVWRRSAVFLIPPPPPGEALPDTSGVAEHVCRLRALWLESAEADSLQAFQVASHLRARVTRLLGEGRPGVLMTGSGTGRWQEGRSWITGKRVVVVGGEPGSVYYPEYAETDTAPIVQLPTAVAASYEIGNGLDVEVMDLVNQTVYPKVAPELLVTTARGDSAVERAGVSGLYPLHQLFARYRDSTNSDSILGPRRVNRSVDTLLLRALTALRDSARLPPSRRAAAFLAADIAVQVHAPWLDYGPNPDSLLRMSLERLGAHYEDLHLGAAWYYQRPWLWRAYQLDSLGPSGNSAFAELIANGWGTKFECAASPTETIQRGERAIAAGHPDPMVHLEVALGYADLFSTSAGGVKQSDSDTVKALAVKAEDARLRAIEHYRQALAQVRDPGLRRTIWDKAVHLMLRLPFETIYDCTGD